MAEKKGRTNVAFSRSLRRCWESMGGVRGLFLGVVTLAAVVNLTILFSKVMEIAYQDLVSESARNATVWGMSGWIMVPIIATLMTAAMAGLYYKIGNVVANSEFASLVRASLQSQS